MVEMLIFAKFRFSHDSAHLHLTYFRFIKGPQWSDGQSVSEILISTESTRIFRKLKNKSLVLNLFLFYQL